MYLLPLWISFFSFFVAISMGRLLGSKGVTYISISCLFACVLISIYVFYEVCLLGAVCNVYLFDWLSIEFVDIHWGLVYDPLSVSMLIIINTVSLCAHIYSIEYMSTDAHITRFISYLSLFTFFMLILVLSDNVLQLFVGWEGVGICSYLLINFWFTRIQANKSAILAVMVNKIGDIALLLGIVFLQYMHKSVALTTCIASATCLFNFSANVTSEQLINIVDSAAHVTAAHSETMPLALHVADTGALLHIMQSVDLCRVVCVCVLFAAIGKSAQAGLHMWLPEAMEGPTPVSSLIHAATMVTAGVFLLLRFSYLFDIVTNFFIVLMAIGSVTAFFASTIGLLQTDIKKVVAYSTCSQLGYMFVCIGFSSYSNSIFHLFNHAFFKALLFLTAGYVIHALSNEQDIRKMGSLLKLLPLPYIMLLIGSLSIMGFPFLSGFYSKDKIIELCFNTYVESLYLISVYKYIIVAQLLCIFAVIFTIVYSIKLFAYVFLNSFSGFRSYIRNIHFSSYYIFIPLMLLSVCSVCSGYLTSDMMVGVGTDYWGTLFNVDSFILPDQLLYINIKLVYAMHTEFTYYIRQITIVWTLYFIVTSFIFLHFFSEFLLRSSIGSVLWFKQLCFLLRKKYIFINRSVLMYVFTTFFYNAYHFFYRYIDKGIIELVGPLGIVNTVRTITQLQKNIQTGLIYHYSGYILLFFIISVHLIYEVNM